MVRNIMAPARSALSCLECRRQPSAKHKQVLGLNLTVRLYCHATVYEAKRTGSSYKRISCFDVPGARRTLHVLYGGRMHYDALIP